MVTLNGYITGLQTIPQGFLSTTGPLELASPSLERPPTFPKRLYARRGTRRTRNLAERAMQLIHPTSRNSSEALAGGGQQSSKPYIG